jgi:hypothetical protein
MVEEAKLDYFARAISLCNYIWTVFSAWKVTTGITDIPQIF